MMRCLAGFDHDFWKLHWSTWYWDPNDGWSPASAWLWSNAGLCFFLCSQITHSASIFSTQWTSHWAWTISSTSEASLASLTLAGSANGFGWFSDICRSKSLFSTHLRLPLTVHHVNLVKKSTGCVVCPRICKVFCQMMVHYFLHSWRCQWVL